MKKVIEYKGKKLEIIARECFDMNEPYYEFWVKEILEKSIGGIFLVGKFFTEILFGGKMQTILKKNYAVNY